MTQLKSILFLLVLLFAEKSIAHQSVSGKIMGSVGPYLYQTQVPENFSPDSPILGGFGILAEGGVDQNGGLEFGFFYLHQNYYRKEGHVVLAEKTKRTHITMGYRHWFNPYFSAGLSFFSAYSIGDYSVIQSARLPSGQTSTSAQDTTEYGFDASFQWEFWQDDNSGVLIDIRYSHSVTPKEGEYSDHYGALLAYKHSIEVK